MVILVVFSIIAIGHLIVEAPEKRKDVLYGRYISDARPH